MGITWNDCVDSILVIAKRKRNIIEHENVCNDLITMYLVHFGYKTHSRLGLKITAILTEYYMRIVNRGKLNWFHVIKSEDVLLDLSEVLHA